ncbi:MAG: hypothetical protein R3Y51_08235, partial [Rikenellaceae bacterium]
LCVYFLADSFISVWLGSEYILGKGVFSFMILSLYVAIMRIPLTVFLNGYSLYKDTWSAWLEAGLNLAISIYGSIHYGLIGVVLGTTISTFVVTFLWKPYFLYTNGFKINVVAYYKEQAKFILPMIILFVLGKFFIESYILENCKTMYEFIAYAVVLFVLASLTYGLVIYTLSRAFREVTNLFIERIFRKC